MFGRIYQWNHLSLMLSFLWKAIEYWFNFLKITYRAIQLFCFSLCEFSRLCLLRVHLFYLNCQICGHKVACSKDSSVTILISMRSVVMIFLSLWHWQFVSSLSFLVSLARGDFGWCFYADFWCHLNQKTLLHTFFHSVFTTVLMVRYSY